MPGSINLVVLLGTIGKYGVAVRYATRAERLAWACVLGEPQP